MSVYKKFPKTDANQTEIKNDLLQLGLSVFETHMIGKGFPDLAIAVFGTNFLVEIKRDHKAGLTKDEVEFHENWDGPIIIAWSAVVVLTSIYDYFASQGKIFSECLELIHKAKQIERERQNDNPDSGRTKGRRKVDTVQDGVRQASRKRTTSKPV